MIKYLKVLFGAVAMVFASMGVQAAIITNGGAPDQWTGYFADAGYLYTETGTQFTLSGGATVNELKWYGAYGNGFAVTDNFTMRIYSGGVLPGALLHTVALGAPSRSATGSAITSCPQFCIGDTEYVYDSTFSDINLLTGTYFITLSNATTGFGRWYWEESSGPSFGGASYSNGWFSTGGKLAFELLGLPTMSIPEPGTFALVILGVAGISVMRRCQRTCQPQLKRAEG